jgi:26S proteasome non-ATPase regulatory subunit 9
MDAAEAGHALKAELRLLIGKAEALERAIKETVDALAQPGLGGLRAPLVDPDGFPRADVDVHGTRTLRQRHASLNTDHKALMAQIEAKMHALHALPIAARAPSVAAAPPAARDASVARAAPPAACKAIDAAGEVGSAGGAAFALIDEVAAGGPAALAGLCVGDALLAFGPVTASTSEPLSAVAREVGAAEAAAGEVCVTVRRKRATTATAAGGIGDEVVVLALHPRRWDGRGLLGCHLAPVSLLA